MRRAALVGLLLLTLISCGQQCPKPPDPTVTVKVCGESLLLPTEWCPDVIEKTFTPGNQPTQTCTLHHAPIMVRVIVCAESGLLPNAYCPAKEEREFEAGSEPAAICTVHKAPTKVADPWTPGGALRAWNGTLYSSLAATLFDEAKLEALYEAMAVDGVNAERNFAWFADVTDTWAGKYLLPWNADWAWNEAYWAQLDRRLNMWCGKRNGTEIISVLDACSMYEGESWEVNPLNKLAARPADVFRAGPARDKVIAFAVELYNRTKKYGSLIVIETRNEGDQIVGFDGLYDYDNAVLQALLAAGGAKDHIATEWYDSSQFYETIDQGMSGKGLAFTHGINSEKSVNWYRDSPGKQGLAALGDRPSADGPDFYDSEGAPLGLAWFWLPSGIGRRASPPQIKYIIRVMSDLGHPGYEFLSASAFQGSKAPDLDAAITLGRAERLAMRR
jgi:hypothetical protein